jgi:hypothetical protein
MCALVSARHIPGSVDHFLSIWKELVQVFNTFTIFAKEFRFSWLGLSGLGNTGLALWRNVDAEHHNHLDEVKNHDWPTISLEEIIEML